MKEPEVLEAIIEHAFDAIVTFTPDGIVSSFSRGAERLFGYSAADVVGRSMRDFHPPEQLRELQANMSEALAGRVTPPYRSERMRRDGSTVTLLITVAPIRDAPGGVQGAVAIARDLTELLDLENRFVQAQKMEAIGRLAGGVAHDFNNLLIVINGYSDEVLARLPMHDPSRELLTEVRRAGERAASLTSQLLAFSRQQMMEARVVDLNEVVRDMEPMLRRLIGEDITLVVSLSPSLHPVKTDPAQVQQVLMNLVVNSRDAMLTGGRLTIETSNVSLDESYRRTHPYVQCGEYAMLAVTDTGIGMDRETRAHIFDPYFTTKPQGKGSGLGLPMTYGIVKQSGGSIEVYSEQGRGTTVKVYLPKTGESPTSRNSSGGELQPASHGTETVLLVEDEDAVRGLASKVLRRNGYTVLEAANGREAVDVVSRHDGPLHLVVSDVVMPHLGGRELAERLREMRPGLRILFTSGYTADAVVRHGILEAEVAFLPKPFTTTGLARKVREVLDG